MTGRARGVRAGSSRVSARRAALALLAAGGAWAGGARIAAAQGTLTLEEAVRTALARSPVAAAAEASAGAASASRWADWGAFLPTADAFITFSSNDFTNVTFLSPEGVSRRLEAPIESTSKFASQSLSLGLTLLDLARVADLRGGAARAEAAELRLTEAERRVVREVKTAYYETLKQERLLEVAERQLEARRQDLELTGRRYRIAAASRSDLLGAEIDAADAELRRLAARDALDAAHRTLRTAMGEPPPASPGEAPSLVDVDSLPEAALLDPEALVRRAFAAYPSLAALERERAAASASVWAARADWFPVLRAGLTFGRSEQLGPGDALFNLDPENTSRTLTVQGSWALFDGFARRRRRAEAGGELRRTEAELAAERLRVEREVRDLAAELVTRDRRLDLLTRNAGLARERLELAREQYRLGSIPYFNLQQAIDRLTSAEQELFRERYDTLIRWAELEERVGG